MCERHEKVTVTPRHLVQGLMLPKCECKRKERDYFRACKINIEESLPVYALLSPHPNSCRLNESFYFSDLSVQRYFKKFVGNGNGIQR